MSRGDKAIHIVNPEQRQKHVHQLDAEGIETTAHQFSGQQLQILNNIEVYLRDGRFNQKQMLAAFEEMASSCRTVEGFPLCRTICRMDWISEINLVLKM